MTMPSGARTAAERFDPRSLDQATERFELLARIRDEAPVAFIPGIGMWAVTGHAVIRGVLDDPQRFPSGGGYSVPRHLPAEALAVYDLDRPLWTQALIGLDGEHHGRLRKPMTAGFTARRVAQLEPDVVEDADRLLAALFDDDPHGDDTTDLYPRFVRPLPSRTAARFFGLPVADAPRFSAWSSAFITMQVSGLPTETYVHSATQFADFDTYIRDIVTGDLDGVGDGILRTLAEGLRDGSHDLTEDEIVGDIANVVFAGHETTVSTLSNMLVRMLQDRRQWDAVAEGSVNVPALCEELLRVDTSVIGLFRSTSSATRLGGVDLPAGVPLWVAFGAANRDPAVFPDPDTMDLDRTNLKEQLTFGRGKHICVGATLARTQIALAVAALPRAYPTLRLVKPRVSWRAGSHAPRARCGRVVGSRCCSYSTGGTRPSSPCSRRWLYQSM